MPYAEAEELGILLGRGDEGLDGVETARAEMLLEMATGAIDSKTEQPLQLQESTHVLDARGGTKLVLPRWPVTAVAAVVVLDERDQEITLTHGADYRWTRWGLLRRVRGCWPCKERSVIVTLTAGYDPIPGSVHAMCLRLALAGWENPAGLESLRLGDWNAKYASAGLTTAELRTLSKYAAH
ncbi:hypothetical protein ACGFIV_00940 [Sphaerisporangium sp. NPDC049003]|uniref:hypothetical protein n=1 Tax=Sphaerisporangium sp. NPDC049003 TaxID=3364517 RepID=UPI00371252A9